MNLMNTFITTVIVNNITADYEIFSTGKKFKAVLMETSLSNCVPYQLTFWKENGEWKTHHLLNQHVIYQFGSNIDNHLTALELANLKSLVAA